MEKAVRINGKEWSQDLQLKALNEISSTGAQDQDENDKEDTLTKEEVKKVTFLDLFKTPNLRKNTLIQYFNWFTTTFVYYGLTLNADTLIPGRFFKMILIRSNITLIVSHIMEFFILFPSFSSRFSYAG